MKIQFNNHSSVTIFHDNIGLLMDPWLYGKVFNNSWDLISKTSDNFSVKNITHIWYSHEHPDHFHPPFLINIENNYKKNITILYKKTRDKKVINFCKKLGFREIIEIDYNSEFKLSDDFFITINKFDHDSSILVRSKKFKVLNLNDCITSNFSYSNSFKSLKNIDVLLSQFSYASINGKPFDKKSREKSAIEQLNQLRDQILKFNPKTIIPFASFVRFSNVENSYGNDSINNIEKVHDFILKLDKNPLIMYPGDIYNLNDKIENEIPLSKYKEDFDKISKIKLDPPKKVNFDSLKASAKNYNDRARKFNFLLVFWIKFFPLKFFIYDLNLKCKISKNEGLKLINTNLKHHVELGSESLEFILKYDYGFDTTLVNGRYRVKDSKSRNLLTRYATISNLINHNESLYSRIILKLFNLFK